MTSLTDVNSSIYYFNGNEPRSGSLTRTFLYAIKLGYLLFLVIHTVLIRTSYPYLYSWATGSATGSLTGIAMGTATGSATGPRGQR